MFDNHCPKCGTWRLSSQHVCPPPHLCREMGKEDWHSISPSRAANAREAAGAFARQLDEKASDRFKDRVIEVRRSGSSEINQFSVSLDFDVTYTVQGVTEVQN